MAIGLPNMLMPTEVQCMGNIALSFYISVFFRLSKICNI